MAIEAFPPLPRGAVALPPDEVEGEILRDPDAPELRERVEFGGPSVTPIDSRYRPDDVDLQAFIRGNADRLRFVIAHMSVNFPPSQPPPLSRATVTVTLEDDVHSGETIAYSIFPTHAGTGYDVTRGFSISPTLTVGPVTAVPGSVSDSRVDHGTQDFVVGGPELSANPSWNFKPTPAQELVGSTRLIMIIQIPKERVGTLSVDLAAEVEHGRFRKRRIPLPTASGANPHAVGF